MPEIGKCMWTLCRLETPKQVLLYCLLRYNQSSEKEIQYFFEIIIFDPSSYTMDHPHFIVCSFMENSIGLKTIKLSDEVCKMTKIVCEYDQEIPQSQTADNPMVPRGRATQLS